MRRVVVFRARIRGISASTLTLASYRPPARWTPVPEPEYSHVQALAQSLLLPEPVCRLLISRGFSEPEAVKRYLRPRLEHLHEPGTMFDLDRAVARMADAVRENRSAGREDPWIFFPPATTPRGRR